MVDYVKDIELCYLKNHKRMLNKQIHAVDESFEIKR
jgi:hypothetical protein